MTNRWSRMAGVGPYAPSLTARSVAVARESFLTTGRVPRVIRPEVAQSWRRSAEHGVADGAMAPVDLTDDALRTYRAAHPLALGMPVIRRLLVEHAVDDDLLVAVGDAAGRLLWVEGRPRLLRQAESMHFVEGARWDEAHAGTNAPGVALATQQAVRIASSEHFQSAVQRWSCSAVPVHGPGGEQIGVIDVTGDDRAAQPTMLALVRATAAAVEAELRLHLPVELPVGGDLALDVLGREDASFCVGGRPVSISPRHAELLLILTANPQGLSADALGCELDERPLDPVTIRAEVSRLRRILGTRAIDSRPYRLTLPLETDDRRVRRLLDRGAYRAALQSYAGPVLPRSTSPAVVRIREELHAEVRDSLLRHPDPTLLAAWTNGPLGRDDLEAWHLLSACLPAGSGRRQRARVHVRLLDEQLG